MQLCDRNGDHALNVNFLQFTMLIADQRFIPKPNIWLRTTN